MRSHLAQQSTIDEKSQVVVDRCKRNRWNATPDRGVNGLRRMVPVGSNNGFVDHLALVRDCQAVLRRQLTELFMAKTHNYWIRTSIKHPEPCQPKNLLFSASEESQLRERDAADERTSFPDLHSRITVENLGVALKGVSNQRMAPQVGLEPTTLRLTAECSAIELLRSDVCILASLASSGNTGRLGWRCAWEGE